MRGGGVHGRFCGGRMPWLAGEFLVFRMLWFVVEKEENLPMARGKKIAQIFTEQFSQNFCSLLSTAIKKSRYISI